MSFSGVRRLRNGTNKLTGSPLVEGTAVLNLSGVPLALPPHVCAVTDIKLRDVWMAGTGTRVTVGEVQHLLYHLCALPEHTQLHTVCNAGRNRSRFAACMFSIIFDLKLPAEPDTNLDFRELIAVASTEAATPTSTRQTIVDAVIDHVQQWHA